MTDVFTNFHDSNLWMTVELLLSVDQLNSEVVFAVASFCRIDMKCCSRQDSVFMIVDCFKNNFDVDGNCLRSVLPNSAKSPINNLKKPP